MKKRFALMIDDVEVRTLEDLQKHFDIETIKKYFLSGELLTWLEERVYDDEAEKVAELSKDDVDLERKLYEIFDIEFDVEEYKLRKERLAKLKTLTDDAEILSKVNQAAFDQEELADRIFEGVNEIYLCDNKFTIPLKRQGKTYIGVGSVTAIIRSKTFVDFEALNIKFSNIKFDEKYQIIESAGDLNKILDIGHEAEKKQNYKTAMECYQKVADLNQSAEAMFAIGNLYYYARGVPQDKEQAFKWYMRAAERGNSEAMNRTAWCYELGEGVKQDLQLAIDWYTTSAELDNYEAMSNLHDIYVYNNDRSKARDFKIKYGESILRAVKTGDIEAMEALRHVDIQEFNKLRRKYVEANLKLAKNGNVDAMKNLFWVYVNGSDRNIPKKWAKKIIDIQLKPAQIGVVDSMYDVAFFMIKEGKYDGEALNWLTKAVEAGNIYAMSDLAFAYNNGRSGLSKNSGKAFELYMKAAEFGNVAAMKYIWSMYYKGVGVKKNKQEAEKWRKKLGRYYDKFLLL